MTDDSTTQDPQGESLAATCCACGKVGSLIPLEGSDTVCVSCGDIVQSPSNRIDGLLKMLHGQKEFEQGKRSRGWDLQFLENELDWLRSHLKDEKNWADHYFQRLQAARDAGHLPDDFEF